MFSAAALVPSPPLLVPELAGQAAIETEDLRAAVRAVAGELETRARVWTAIGVGPSPAVLTPPLRGTFRGFGADVEVAFGSAAGRVVDPDLPLAALVAGWIRRECAPSIDVEVRILSADTSPAECVEYGRTLRARMDSDDTPSGLLVIGDGANTLTAGAPGAFDPESVPVQELLDEALAVGDPRPLLDLDPAAATRWGIGGRVPWQVLAGVFEASNAPPHCRTDYSGAPYGVAYHVGMWTS